MDSEQDKEVLDRGSIWREFKSTVYSQELYKFFDEQERTGKDVVCDLTIAGKYEEAKAAGHKLAGVLAVRSHIEDSIVEMMNLIQDRDERRKQTRKQRTHVR